MDKYNTLLPGDLHWFLSGIAFRTESLVWRCQLGLAPTYLCRPVSGARDSRPLRSAVDPICPYSGNHQNRIFSMSGPEVWNDLPQELRLFLRLSTNTCLGHLKTYLYDLTGVGNVSE